MESGDENLTPQLLSKLWTMAKAQKVPDDEGLEAFQKFMVMHEDMHEYWERLEKDPSTSLDVDGENLLLHIAMDAATLRGLEENEPPGLQDLLRIMLRNGIDKGRAFHVLSRAMQHEFLEAASKEQMMDLQAYVRRAGEYVRQVMTG
jgi:hypothetical protein